MPSFDPRCCIFCGDVLIDTDERGPIVTMKDGASYHFLCGLASLNRHIASTHRYDLSPRVVEQDPPREENN